MPTFANTINDNQILAKRSQCDYAGNDIQTTYATKTEFTTGLASKQDTISDLSTIRSGAAAGATAVQPGSLATVATSGSYNDLSNRPTIPTVDQTYNASSTNAQSGTAVAGAISGINQVPASTSSDADKVLKVNSSGTPEWSTGGGSQVQSDWTEADSSAPSYIENKPVPKTLTAGTGISISETSNAITIANTAPDTVASLPTNLTAAQIQAFKEALGVDETVLWEGTAEISNFPITLSEVPTNFERIRISFKSWTDNPTFNEFSGSAGLYNLNSNWTDPNGVSFYFNEKLTLNGMTLSFIAGKFCAFGDNIVNDQTNNFTVYKVVGIHRVASN